MADSNILAFTEITTMGGDEMMYLVDDPTGSPADRKGTVSNLATSIAALADFITAVVAFVAWQPVTATWTRTGNFTFTVSGDVTATYEKGVRVRYKDGGSFEYGVVGSSSYSAPNTTVTLITNSDYAMGATTITDKSISRISQPSGWPDYFNWAPTIVGFSAAPAGGLYKWRAEGKTLSLTIRQPADGTSSQNNFTISLPFAAATITDMAWAGPSGAVDNSAILTSPSRMYIASTYTVVEIFSNYGAGTWTTSGGKRLLTGSISYQF